jgi:hypothetical protein
MSILADGSRDRACQLLNADAATPRHRGTIHVLARQTSSQRIPNDSDFMRSPERASTSFPVQMFRAFERPHDTGATVLHLPNGFTTVHLVQQQQQRQHWRRRLTTVADRHHRFLSHQSSNSLFRLHVFRSLTIRSGQIVSLTVEFSLRLPAARLHHNERRYI